MKQSKTLIMIMTIMVVMLSAAVQAWTPADWVNDLVRPNKNKKVANQHRLHAKENIAIGNGASGTNMDHNNNMNRMLKGGHNGGDDLHDKHVIKDDGEGHSDIETFPEVSNSNGNGNLNGGNIGGGNSFGPGNPIEFKMISEELVSICTSTSCHPINGEKLPSTTTNKDTKIEVEKEEVKMVMHPNPKVIAEDLHLEEKEKATDKTEEDHTHNELIQPKMIAEDLHDVVEKADKTEDTHNELIQPKIIAEDLHLEEEEKTEEDHTHNELIQPKIIAEDLHEVVEKTDKTEDTHNELIQPKIIAEDLHEVVEKTEEDHTHNELIQPKISNTRGGGVRNLRKINNKLKLTKDFDVSKLRGKQKNIEFEKQILLP